MNFNSFAVAGIPEIMQQLFPNLPNFIAHVLATVIIVVLLTYLVYKPYHNFVGQRQAKINELLDDAVGKQTQATIDGRNAQRLLDDAKSESALIIKNAQIDAQAQRNQILQNATLEINTLQVQAKNELEKSRLDAEQQIKKDIVVVAFQAAEKLLGENLTNEKNQQMIDEFINNLDKE